MTAVNIEQNSSRTPIPYVSPPGVLRQQELSNNNVNLLLNEQAMSLQICNLTQGDARGVYKTTNSRSAQVWHDGYVRPCRGRRIEPQ